MMVKKTAKGGKFLAPFSLLLLLILGWFLHMGSGQVQEQQEDYYPSRSAMESQEQEALYSAIKGFVGDWWNGSDLYPDPCGWTPIQGVACDLYNGYWYVTSISIFGQSLENSLRCNETAAKFPPQLFELRHLKSLSMTNCFTSPIHNPTQLPTSKWETFSGSLESLEFRSNPGLIGIVPLAIVYLKQLESLVLIENGLSGNLPMELGGLVKLKRLVLAGNKFSGPIPESLGGLSELLILDSSRNNLSGSIPLTFGGLTSLLKLDLSRNKLEGSLPGEVFGRLINLTLLDIGGNNLSGGFAQSLEEMVSLEEFSASNNPGIGGDLIGVASSTRNAGGEPGTLWSAKWTWPRRDPKRVPTTRGPSPVGWTDRLLPRSLSTERSLATDSAGSFLLGVCIGAGTWLLVELLTYLSSFLLEEDLKVGIATSRSSSAPTLLVQWKCLLEEDEEF